MKKCVLIVDDDLGIRKLVEAALKQNNFSVLHADSGEKAMEILKSHSVDVIILDIMLPGIDGLETLKRIRNNSCIKQLPVIMLTSKSSEIDSVLGLELGADDYVCKPIRYYELIARVKSVLRRAEPSLMNNSHSIVIGELEINMDNRSVTYRDHFLTLSYKEYELLLLLAKAPGRVFSRNEILDHVWKEEYSLETRTVDVHIRRLRSKFEQTGCKEVLIETVRNIGYRLVCQVQQ